MGSGAPRTDPYLRLIARFYEAYNFLTTIKKVQGPHLVINHDASSLQSTRRRVANNLAFLCDYKKGGASTCAVAIQDTPECYRFWIASNEGPKDFVVQFLTHILDSVRAIITLTGEQRSEALEGLIRECCSFSKLRMKKEANFLVRAAQRGIAHLSGSPDRKALADWLHQFCDDNSEGYGKLSLLAYENRHDHHMRSVQLLAREPDDGSDTTEIAQTFGNIRHFIGRLAAHQRVPRQLVEDGERLPELLEPYVVEAVSYMASIPKPQPDHKTNMEGILKRMLPASDPRYDEIKEQLHRMDPESSIEQAILLKYQSPSFRPRAHAEVQMIEHFYMNNLKFAWNEKLIGCSKPACLCCRLYFEHHPLKPAALDSHGKVYSNWGPVGLSRGAKDPEWLRFRNQLNSMIPVIRNAVLEHITQLILTRDYRPDSLTGLTVSELLYYESDVPEDSGISSHGQLSYDEAEAIVQPGQELTTIKCVNYDEDSETDTSDEGGVLLS